jgi:hypothetical protein
VAAIFAISARLCRVDQVSHETPIFISKFTGLHRIERHPFSPSGWVRAPLPVRNVKASVPSSFAAHASWSWRQVAGIPINKERREIMTDAPPVAEVFVVSDEMFERFTRWVEAMAEERFRRMAMGTRMGPEIPEQLREQVVAAIAENIEQEFVERHLRPLYPLSRSVQQTEEAIMTELTTKRAPLQWKTAGSDDEFEAWLPDGSFYLVCREDPDRFTVLHVIPDVADVEVAIVATSAEARRIAEQHYQDNRGSHAHSHRR